MNMSEFDSCVHRIIKRIYPVLAYEYEMGLCESRGEPSGIYSFQLLRSLHENSMENIHKILRQTEADDECKKEFDKAEKKILLEFFTYLNEKKSQLTQKWLNLQHYMHYIYRTLTSANPQVHNKEVSEYFIAEMKNLVQTLSEADKIQLYLRIFSILREYITFAFWQYSKSSHKEPPIERLHRCYQAFLIASRNVYPVFIDLERLLKDKCNMTWMDYNKFVFFNYFYDAIDTEILKKVNAEENTEVPKEYNSMMLDFGELNTLWQTLKNLRGINENMDEEMSEDHKQILKKNFWICRKKTDREIQNVQRLAAELIILASERRIRGSEPFLDKNGQCLCEDCLIYKLSYIVEPGEEPNPTIMRVSPCRYCPEIVELHKLHDHVTEHLKALVGCEDGKVAFTILENEIDIIKMGKDAEKNGKDCEKKLSQCLINLLKKTNNSNKPDVKVQQSNTKLDEKKKETGSKNSNSKENVRLPAANKNESSCLHNCKHEEELSAELKKLQGVCNHHKDSRRCDCTYCEVFGSNVSTHLHKSNETRNRLRIRLNQRKQKMFSKNPLVDKTNKILTKPVAVSPSASNKIESTITVENTSNIKNAVVKTVPKCDDSVVREPKITSEILKSRTPPKTSSDTEKLNDIHGLVDFIEGNSLNDKVAIAEKKAAKKARQREKKEEKRKQTEVELKRKNDIKSNEESKLRLLAQLQTEASLLNEANKKNSKKQKCKGKTNTTTKSDGSELIEETIPATVTIKRSIENGDNIPTVTITLKGSTPDQDKLLYALVKGCDQDHNEKKATTKSKKNKKQSDPLEQKIEHSVMLQVLQKDVAKKNNCKLKTSTEKEIKVSFTVSNSDKETEKKIKQEKHENEKNEELELPFLKLPPGITITKVDGPLSNKNSKGAMNGFDATNSNISVNGKSGVIVVDTEKLIQTNDTDKVSRNTRKNKKKKNKKRSTSTSTASNQASMVTLKNPIFHPMSETKAKEPSLPLDLAGASCGQASIFKNENGMVTIRSSRLQNSLNNGVPLHNILSDLKPVIGDIATPISTSGSSTSENTINSFNAQEFLSGLPGIEITKIDKKNPRFENDPKACQIAQVSIIPANGENYSLDKDEWIYDNIFTPKDVLEDDLDAEERELEAFKRFCQQSIPPKQKEKVAHLNVKDIILKKKNDISSI